VPASLYGQPALPLIQPSPQQIVELRDKGMTWNEDGRTAVYDSFRRLEPLSEGQATKATTLGPLAAVLANAIDENVAVGVRATVTDNLGREPTRAELNAARRAAHSLAVLGRARVLHVPGADLDANTGDRSYLVLAKPSVIMNDIRRRG
jgi:hypothetical protein